MAAELTAEEIKGIRQQYGLSQKSFALLLGIGPASIVRYEQGSKPSKANANLIRAARHPEFMLECLAADGDLLPEAQRAKAQHVTYACISLEPEDDAAAGAGAKGGEYAFSAGQRMNEMYELTLRQEVLNEQAANILGEIISIKINSGFVGSASDVFDNLLDQVARVKYAIIGMNDHAKLDEVEGYLKCAQELLSKSVKEVA